MSRKVMPWAVVLFIFGVGAGLWTPTSGQTTPAATRPLATATAPVPVIPVPLSERHVVIISIDGCRPDVLLRANTPVIHGLLNEGSFTFYAETTDIAITLPSHTSMLTGVKPEVHRINFNTDPPEGAWPAVPTVLELAHAKGLTTGVFSTKSKFSLYTRPNTIDYVGLSKESSSANDMASAKGAADAILQHKPAAMLVHMGNNDKVGHAIGWGTPEQLTALAGADAGVGVVIDALKQAGIYDKTLIIISADHGGSGKGHGDKLDTTTKANAGEKDWRSRYIPWIAVGPGVNKGYDLTRVRTVAVHTEDTFATACYFLEITPPGTIYGKPVTNIWTAKEPLPKPATIRTGTTATAAKAPGEE